MQRARARHRLGGAARRRRGRDRRAAEAALSARARRPAAERRAIGAPMMGLFASLFATRPSRCCRKRRSRDAAAIAALHAASFRRGWSEQEVEGLLLDRHVIAHRAMIGRRARRLHHVAAGGGRGGDPLGRGRRRAGAGRGLARNLLDLHLRRLAGLGARAVFLEVDEHNAAAIRLYDRAGFREVSRRPNYYPGRRRARPPPRWCCAAIWSNGPIDQPGRAQYAMRAGPETTRKPIVTTPDKGIPDRRNIEALCAAKGMRMTEQRRTIARVLAGVRRSSRRRGALPALRQGRRPDFHFHRLSHRAPVRGCRHHRAARFPRGPRPLRNRHGIPSRPSDQSAQRRGDRIPLGGDRAPAGGSRAQARLQAGRSPARALCRAARRRQEPVNVRVRF